MDTSDFINTGLEEQGFKTYRCPTCKKEKEVAVEYLKHAKIFVPVHIIDTLCENHDIDELMEMEEV